jgi:hypothetical protein
LPPTGWYPDPGGSGGERWWDGHQWTGQLRPPPLSSSWRGWLTRSPKAAAIGRVIACVAAGCASGAFLVGLLALLRDKPLSWAGVLLVPAVPALAVGQVWTIAQINARLPSSGRWRERIRMQRSMSPRAFFFGDLSRRVAGPLLGIAFAGWLSAMTALPSQGATAASAPGCPYRLDDHGPTTCVSKRTYEHVGAGEQRFASGILLGFFAIHTGAALGGLRFRRDAGR